MSYRITEKSLNGLDVIEIQNQISGEYINIVPGYGGAINEVVLSKGNILYSIHKCAKSLQEFKKVSLPMYAGSFLAPFPNRVANGSYRFNGTKYQLALTDPGLPNALHGFLYKAPFKMVGSCPDKGEVVLEHFFNGATGYPFKVFFRNTFQLTAEGFYIKSYARNENNENIPFGMGWHPYIATGGSINNLQAKMPSTKTFELNDNYIPNGTLKNNQKYSKLATIANEFMNDCYEVSDLGQTVIYDPDKNLNIFVNQKTGKKAYNYCMYYTPPARDCIAIEPMTAAPDAFNNGHGTIVLKPQETIELKFGITINLSSF